MVTRIDFNTLTFGEPLYLWLLAVPGVLLALWVLQVVRRRADTQRYAQLRVVPVRERFSLPPLLRGRQISWQESRPISRPAWCVTKRTARADTAPPPRSWR